MWASVVLCLCFHCKTTVVGAGGVGGGGGGLACIPKQIESGKKLESTRHPNKVREA